MFQHHRENNLSTPKARQPKDQLLSLVSATERSNWKPTHRHRKGGLYRVLGRGCWETDRSQVVIYSDVNGKIWVRPAKEFEDGRFETCVIE